MRGAGEGTDRPDAVRAGTPHGAPSGPDSLPPAAVDAAARFAARTWTAGVIGLGYVGLPLAVAVVSAGLRCVGFDVSPEVVAGLAAGRSHVGDVSDALLGDARAAGLVVTDDEATLAGADALLVCVPSPLGRNRQPDLSYIEAAAGTIARTVTPGTLVVLESTTYPGTTDEVIVAAATSGDLTLDRDVFVAFSPERVDPGNPRSTADIPKVVGGVTPASGHVAAAAYRRLVSQVHVVSTARAAEMTKLLENIYRSVNIGLINEIAQLAHQLDINVWEVIDAAATKPFGFHAFRPGPGVGGHCIPLDPQFLAWRAREARFATRFIDLADQVNTAMPAYTITRMTALLNDRRRAVAGADILALGVAYKPGVADDRESPAWEVLGALVAGGAAVTVHDPVVGTDRITARGYAAAVDLRPARLAAHDLTVVLCDHDAIDWPTVAAHAPLVFDARGAFHRRAIAGPHIVPL